MIIPKDLASIFMEDIVNKYLPYYPYQQDVSHFLTYVHHYMENNFNISWSGGGTQGSCWDDDGPREVLADDEPEMHNLNKFLDKYFIGLDKEIIKEIKKEATEDMTQDSDYYGGTTFYHKKQISFYKIAEILIPTIYKDNKDYVNFETVIQSLSKEIINMRVQDYNNFIFKNYLDDKIENKIEKQKKVKI